MFGSSIIPTGLGTQGGAVQAQQPSGMFANAAKSAQANMTLPTTANGPVIGPGPGMHLNNPNQPFAPGASQPPGQPGALAHKGIGTYPPNSFQGAMAGVVPQPTTPRRQQN